MRSVLYRCIDDCSDEDAFRSDSPTIVCKERHALTNKVDMGHHGGEDSSILSSEVADIIRFLAVDSDESPSPAVPSIGGFPEQYWHSQVVPHFSQGRRDLLAERLFCHIWKEQGQETALGLLSSITDENLQKTADARFDLGCRLWGEEQHHRALWELQRSRAVREVQNEMSLLHVRHGDPKNTDEGRDEDQDQESGERSGMMMGGTTHSVRINTLSPSTTESHAQLFYALGTVQLALNEPEVALKEFRRSMQISVLGLGDRHHLTEATKYMIRTTLLTLGHPSHRINQYLEGMMDGLRREMDGDGLFAAGEWDEALLEYVNVQFLKDRDTQTQARIRAKMAMVFEEKGDHMKALELWSTVMALYARSSTIGLDHPLTRHATKKFIENRGRVSRFEI